ncbi:ATP-binding protein [Pueribacillus sp. YX66]|uniref:ATP-binding protein n=1 Tax=Pueribacillus sp. YX66 TaxID=3229242 RepID=UPI00358D6716
MFWNSVVFKLWYTIILFFSVVLFILTILLLEFFQTFHLNSAEEQLTKLADKVAVVMETYEDYRMALSTAWEIVDASSARFVIIASKDQYWYSPNPANIESLPIKLFFENEHLSKVINEQEKVVIEGYFPSENDTTETNNEVIIVGVPLSMQPNKNGGVFLYQSLDVVQNTMEQVKRIIYISAGIAIVLTTVFAFFLSTRINAPLRKMKEAATNAAKGKFNTNIPIVTRDEIGELASAFNQMAKEIRTNIEALNQEKEQLSGILSSMADGVITFDRTGQILQTNPPAERFLQAWYYEQGMHDLNLINIPSEIKKLFQKVVSLEKEQLAEVSMQGRTWVVVMTPLYSRSYVRGAVAVLRDMTEERRMDKLREDFIANVSHELRTPIALLQGYSEAIVDNVAGSEEENRELGKIIYEESLRMGRLVNELLDLARMETGNIQLMLNEVEIMAFSERVTRKFQAMAKEQGISLTLQLGEDNKIYMRIDSDRIEQVLTNLIDNAIRHTNEGGKVVVRVEAVSTGIKYEIEDSGSGIPEEDLPFVFERFYKADKARTRGRSGTGLGLAIAKNIVESHGGQIYVHSIINKGTTFSFFLPFHT